MARITGEEFFQSCALSHCPHLTNSFKHKLLICLSCFQELIWGVDASQGQALNLPSKAGPGILQWMSSFYGFLEVRGRIWKAMTLGERSALSPARDWPRVVVFAKPRFYGAFVTWWETGWVGGGCRYSPGLLWSLCTQWGARPWNKSPELQQSPCGCLYKSMIWPLGLRLFCRNNVFSLFFWNFSGFCAQRRLIV